MSNKKDPKNIKFYKYTLINEDQTDEQIQLLAFLFGISAVLLQVKLLLWAAFFVNISCFLKLKYNSDWKQIFFSQVMIFMGFYNLYYHLPRQKLVYEQQSQ